RYCRGAATPTSGPMAMETPITASSGVGAGGAVLPGAGRGSEKETRPITSAPTWDFVSPSVPSGKRDGTRQSSIRRGGREHGCASRAAEPRTESRSGSDTDGRSEETWLEDLLTGPQIPRARRLSEVMEGQSSHRACVQPESAGRASQLVCKWHA